MHELVKELQSYSSESFLSWLSGPYAWTLYAAAFLVGGLLVLAWISLMAIIWTYGERRIAGAIQGRKGPNRVGPLGILQPFADGIKLLAKEDIIPKIAHRFLYTLAPLIVFIGALLPFAALPFSERLVVVNMDIALFYILAFEALEVIGVLMAGWAPGSKWSLYGGMRLAAQMLSYEIPMGICILVIVLLTGSLNLGEIVAWQSHVEWLSKVPYGEYLQLVFAWAIFRSPAAALAFIIFYVGGLASAKRAPFDLPEAESELVAGYHTEYSGMRFAYFFMAEYGSMYIVCALAAILFLGGWNGPIPRPDVAENISMVGNWMAILHSSSSHPGILQGLLSSLTSPGSVSIMLSEGIGVVNLLMKSFFLYFVMIWLRWTLPRIRIDQVMYLCLKVLLPFSLGCLVFALFQVVFFP